MNEQQRIKTFEALAKLALKIIKNEDYDALSDENKENVVSSAISILRQLHRKHGKIDAKMIINDLLQCCVNDEDYVICDNAAKAMNYVMRLEELEEKALCFHSDIVGSKQRIAHYQELIRSDEEALKDVEGEIEAMKA
jgi:hypothetical protein